jgi:hypothetical protein
MSEAVAVHHPPSRYDPKPSILGRVLPGGLREPFRESLGYHATELRVAEWCLSPLFARQLHTERDIVHAATRSWPLGPNGLVGLVRP